MNFTAARPGYVLLLLLAIQALPACAQDPDQAPGARPVPAQPSSVFRPIQAPQDPAKVRGTYEIGGKTVPVTEGEFFATYELLKPHEERKEMPLQPPRILEHILLLAEAKELGVYPTPEEIDLLNPVHANPALGQQMLDRFKAQGISTEQYLRYLAETRAIARLKDWWASAARVRSNEAYDAWKRENLLYGVEYVAFAAAKEESALRSSPPDEKALKEFWSTSAEVQAKYRSQTAVSAEIVWLDANSIPAAEIERRLSERPVTRDEALAYFRTHKDRLLSQIPSDQRPRLYPAAGASIPISAIVTPFEILKPLIEREILLGGGIEDAFKKAREAGAAGDLAAIAKECGVSLTRIEDVDRRGMMDLHARFGPNLFQEIYGVETGAYSPMIHRQGGLAYFWKQTGRKAATLPEFEAVRERIAEDWYAAESFARARAAAKSFLDAVEAAADKEFESQFAAIDKEANEAAEAELKERNPSDAAEAELIRQKHRSLAEGRKRRLRLTSKPTHFDDQVAARGVELKRLPPFAFTYTQINRAEISGAEEQAKAFFSSAHQVRAMEVGQVSPILSDSVTSTHFVARVVSREEPDFAAMPIVDYYQRRSILERNAVFSSSFRWAYFQVQKRRNWKEQ